MNALSKLAVGAIKSHRIRSLMIGVAVILTSVLYMTVMSITFNILGGYQLMLQLAGGSNFHASINAPDFILPPEELLQKVTAEPSVKGAYLVASTDGMDSAVSDASGNLYAFNNFSAAEHLFITLTEGVYPQTTGEIALNRRDYPNAKLGDTLNMTFRFTAIDDNGNITSDEYPRSYTVTAFYDSEADRGAQPSALTLYAADDAMFANRESILIDFHHALNICGKLDKLTEKLHDYIPAGETIHTQINNAFLLSSKEVLRPANVIVVVFSVAVVFFCAFLLIYNIYSIALTQDIHTFGLLGVIGTTYRQLRTLIRRQTLFLYLLSAPVGLLAGYFIGWKLLSPVFMSMSGQSINYRFNVWIVAVSALLTLFTLLYSALRPMRKIKRLTPIEAVNTGAKPPKKTEKKPSDVNPLSLAFNSAKRNPKRLAVTAMSAALSVVVVMLIATFATLVREIGRDELSLTDIQITMNSTTEVYNAATGTTKQSTMNAKLGSGGIDPSVLDKVRALDGAGDIWTIRYTEADVTASDKSRAMADVVIAQLPEEDREYYHIDRLEQIADGSLHAIFVSVPDDLCKYILIGKKEYYSGKELYDSGHVISLDNFNTYYVQTDDGSRKLTLGALYETGDSVYSDTLSKDYTAIKPDLDNAYNVLSRITGYISWEYNVQIFIMPESVFKAEFGDGTIYSILGNYSETLSVNKNGTLSDAQKEFRRAISTITADYTVDNGDSQIHLAVSGRFDGFEELQNRVYAIQLTGYSLSVIIFAIGVINLANSSLSSVTERRREYAMLEAVGMTQGQLRLMILTEGLIASLLASVIALAAGIPALRLFIELAIGDSITVEALPGVLLLIVITLVSVVLSLTAFRELHRAPLTERLRTE